MTDFRPFCLPPCAVRVVIASALLASSAAHAVRLAPNELGQALIFPYYTVNKSQDTYVSISNGTASPMVVKVNVLEGRNGRPVLDLVVYLGPNDSWSAAITQVDDEGGAMLRTQDRSCSTPAIPPAGLHFSASGYDGNGDLPADDGPADIARTREGSVEAIVGGWVEPDTATARALELDEAGVPVGCDSLPGTMPSDIMPTYSGSLFGYGAIIDVGQGTYFPYDATQIADFTDTALFTANTGPHEPTLLQANTEGTATPGGAIANFAITDAFPFQGRVFEAEFERGIDAVSAVLMADQVFNDFLVAPALGAATDWVVSFPTWRFYRDPIYPTAWRDVVRLEVAVNGPDGRTMLPDPSDPTRDDITLPYVVNVIGLTRGTGGGVSPVFGSQLATHLDPGTDSGTLRLDIWGHRTGGELVLGGGGFGVYSTAGYVWGIPATGFMAYNIVNAHAAPGRLANYGGTFAHRQRSCMRIHSIYTRVCSTEY